MSGVMDTFHASKQPSHGSLAADNTHVDWLGHLRVDTGFLTRGGIHGSSFVTPASRCTVNSMTLGSQLFHPLAESHGKAAMEMEEEVSSTASPHTPPVQHSTRAP